MPACTDDRRHEGLLAVAERLASTEDQLELLRSQDVAFREETGALVEREVLARVGLKPEHRVRYPHAFSYHEWLANDVLHGHARVQ